MEKYEWSYKPSRLAEFYKKRVDLMNNRFKVVVSGEENIKFADDWYKSAYEPATGRMGYAIEYKKKVFEVLDKLKDKELTKAVRLWFVEHSRMFGSVPFWTLKCYPVYWDNNSNELHINITL